MISNNQIKHFSSLLTKKYRLKENKFIIEGEKSVIEGIKSKLDCEAVLFSRKYYEQAIKNDLLFSIIHDPEEKNKAYEIISSNRKRYDRPIYMSIDDINKIEGLWPVEFFGVWVRGSDMLASGILYRFPNNISYVVFWTHGCCSHL